MGGSSETKGKNEAPAWWTNAAKGLLERGTAAADMGYVPFMGGDVAAFTPQQNSAFQQAADWSAAFNTPGQAAPNVAASQPQSSNFGGVQGYSSFPGFQDAMKQLEQQMPGLYAYLKSFSVDPITGAKPTAFNTNPRFKRGKPTSNNLGFGG